MKKFLLMIGVLVALGSCTSRAADTETRATENVAATSAVEHFVGTDITPDKTLPIVIDFNADWCPPCRMFGPVFDEVAESMQGKARFVSVNVDDNNAVARKFGVSAIPQITVLKPDGSVLTATGYMDRPAFEQFLGKALQ